MFKASVMKKTYLITILLVLFYASALYAGVGGGVEGKEKVDIVPLIKWTLVFLAGLGTVFGISIAFAAKRFAVLTGT